MECFIPLYCEARPPCDTEQSLFLKTGLPLSTFTFPFHSIIRLSFPVKHSKFPPATAVERFPDFFYRESP